MRKKVAKLLTIWIPVKAYRKKARTFLQSPLSSIAIKRIRKSYRVKFLEYRNKYSNNRFRITIFVPCYNSEKSLAVALDSIITQKTSFKIKILVVDDLSTDNTVEVIKSYVKSHPEMVTAIYRDENLGVPHNHYHAITENVDTEFFTTLDSDDSYTDPFKIQAQVDLLDSNLDCSYSAHSVERKEALNKSFILPSVPSGIYTNYFYTHTASKVYRSAILEFLRDKNHCLCVDCATGSIASYLGKMAYIDRPMSVYNYNNQGIWSSLTESIQRKRKYYLANILYFYTKGHFGGKHVDLAMQKNETDRLQSIPQHQIK